MATRPRGHKRILDPGQRCDETVWICTVPGQRVGLDWSHKHLQTASRICHTDQYTGTSPILHGISKKRRESA